MKRRYGGCKNISMKTYNIIKIVAIILLIIGIGIIVYPSVGNMYSKAKANRVVEDFETRVSNIKKIKNKKVSAKELQKDVPNDGINEKTGSKTVSIDYTKIDINSMYKDSKKYNNKLKKKQRDLLTTDDVFNKPALHLSKYGIYDGVYGYISIPSIDLKIPIYLGVQNNHMNYGSAHLTYTSLPIGGKNENSVLVGHTGYTGRILFDNITKLSKGATVTVVNYWGRVKYKVTKHKVVKPDDLSNYFIDENKTELVLVTCISDGYGGFNRYLLYCEK